MSQGGSRQSRRDKARGEHQREDLGECIEAAVASYFRERNGCEASGLYQVFIGEVEKAFFCAVMRECGGNISEATRVLGIHRVTLRKRLRLYGLCKDSRGLSSGR